MMVPNDAQIEECQKVVARSTNEVHRRLAEQCERLEAEIATLRAALAQPVQPAGKDALEGIAQYGQDTLSGRTDGPDDRFWQRQAVAEMTQRAKAALKAITQPAPQAVQEPATDNSVLQLAELMRGLEMSPTSATLTPGQLHLIGAAICRQAKLAQPAPQTVPKCVAIIEVLGKDWRIEYMSLPVGKHKLYAQEYNYTAQPVQTDDQKPWFTMDEWMVYVKKHCSRFDMETVTDGVAQEPLKAGEWTKTAEALPALDVPVLVQLDGISGIRAMVRLDDADGWLWATHRFGPLDDPTGYEADDEYDVLCWTALPGNADLSGAASRHSHFWRDYEAASA